MAKDRLMFVLVAALAVVAMITAILRSRSRWPETPVGPSRLQGLPEQWSAPDELLASSTPREVWFTTGARLMFAMMAALAVGFTTVGVLLIPGMQQASREIELVRQTGVATNAAITAKRMQGGKSSSYHVTYVYEVGDHQYRSEARVERVTYERLAIGSTVTVRYVPSRPDLRRLDGEASTPPQVVLLVFLPIVAFLIAPLVVTRRRQLLAWGTPTGAVVTRVAPYKGSQAIRYQFLDSSGEPVTGSDIVPRPDAVNVGDVITVVFDPDRPRRNARYPMAMVAVGI